MTFDNWPSICALSNISNLVSMHETKVFSMGRLQLSNHPQKYSKMRKSAKMTENRTLVFRISPTQMKKITQIPHSHSL